MGKDDAKKPRTEMEEAGSAPRPLFNVDNFMCEIAEVAIKDLPLTIDEIVFQGFKPREFIVRLHRVAVRAGISSDIHKQNLLLLGLVCALRGSKINKILSSSGSTTKLKNTLSGLRGLYEIIDGKPTEPTSPTLPRFLAVTALPVSGIIAEDGGDKIALPLHPSEVAPGHPFVFCMSHAGALLPTHSTANDTLAKAVAYAQYLMIKEGDNDL